MNAEMIFAIAGWAGATLVMIAAVVLAVVAARTNTPLLGAVAVVPVTLGLLAHAFGLAVAAPNPILLSLFGIAVFALGVVAGSPLTLFVIRMVEKAPAREGLHGGIVTTAAPKREVLRGGAAIGYLERLAFIGCVAIGHVEGVAILIAIKGLGRFSDLTSPEAQERFILGTLVSLIWAGACAALIVLQ